MKQLIIRLLSARSITSRFKITLNTWLLACSIPWAIIVLRFAMRQIPYAWEYSRIPFLKDRPIPWRIWYCTEDSTGNEGKAFLPEDPAYILFGGAKYYHPLTNEEIGKGRAPYPASFCSTERYENRVLPDSVRLVWTKDDHTLEKWITIKDQLTPTWGMNRQYTFMLRTRTDGQVDFHSAPDSLNFYAEVRNFGFEKIHPGNEKQKPHSSVW